MEVLGAAGSIVGITAFGLQLSQVLVRFISEVRAAPEAVRAVLAGVDATSRAMKEIYGLLNDEKKNIEREGKSILFSIEGIQQLRATADSCLLLFWKIEATIANRSERNLDEKLQRRLRQFRREIETTTKSKIAKPNQNLVLSTRDRLRWPYITPKLEEFSRQLRDLQVNLVLLFQVVNLRAVSLRSKSEVQDVKLLTEVYTQAIKAVVQAKLTSDRIDRDDYHLRTARDRNSHGARRNQGSIERSPRGFIRINRRATMPVSGSSGRFRTNEYSDEESDLQRVIEARREQVGDRCSSIPRQRASRRRRPNRRRSYISSSEGERLTGPPIVPPNGAGRSIDDSEDSDDENWLAQKRVEVKTNDRLAKAEAAISKGSKPLAKVPDAPVSNGVRTQQRKEKGKAKGKAKGKDKGKGREKEPKVHENATQTSPPDHDMQPGSSRQRADATSNSSDSSETEHPGKANNINSWGPSGPNGKSNVKPKDGMSKTTIDQSQSNQSRSKEGNEQLAGSGSGQHNVVSNLNDATASSNNIQGTTQVQIQVPDEVPVPLPVHSTQLPEEIHQNGNDLANDNSNFINLTLSPGNLTTYIPEASDAGDDIEPSIGPGVSAMSTLRTNNPLRQSYLVNKPKPGGLSWSQMKSRLRRRVEKGDQSPGRQVYNSDEEEDEEIYFTGYFIRGKDFFRVPNAHMQTLKKIESEWFKFQPKEKSWWKTLAFLEPEELEAVQRLLDGDSLTGKHNRNLVLLKRLKKGRLKFWAATEEKLLAIISDQASNLFNAELPQSGPTKQLEVIAELGSSPVAKPQESIKSGGPQEMVPDTKLPKINPTDNVKYVSNGLENLGTLQVLDSNLMISQLSPLEHLSDRQSRKLLTTYNVYTISPIDAEFQNTDEAWIRCRINKELFNNEGIVAQIEFLGNNSASVIQKKSHLSFNQQSQIDNLLRSICSSEKEHEFEWMLCQLEVRNEQILRATSLQHIFRQKAKAAAPDIQRASITVFFQRAPKPNFSCIELLRKLHSQHTRILERGRLLGPKEDPIGVLPSTENAGVEDTEQEKENAFKATGGVPQTLQEDRHTRADEPDAQRAQDDIHPTEPGAGPNSPAPAPAPADERPGAAASQSPRSDVNTSLNPENSNKTYPTNFQRVHLQQHEVPPFPLPTYGPGVSEQYAPPPQNPFLPRPVTGPYGYDNSYFSAPGNQYDPYYSAPYQSKGYPGGAAYFSSQPYDYQNTARPYSQTPPPPPPNYKPTYGSPSEQTRVDHLPYRTERRVERSDTDSDSDIRYRPQPPLTRHRSSARGPATAMSTSRTADSRNEEYISRARPIPYRDADYGWPSTVRSSHNAANNNMLATDTTRSAMFSNPPASEPSTRRVTTNDSRRGDRPSNLDDPRKHYGELEYPPSRPSEVAHAEMLKQQYEKYQKEAESVRDRRPHIPYPEYYDDRPYDPRDLKQVPDLLQKLLLKWTPSERDNDGTEAGNDQKKTGQKDQSTSGAGMHSQRDAASTTRSSLRPRTHPAPTRERLSSPRRFGSSDEGAINLSDEASDKSEAEHGRHTKDKANSRVTFSNYAEPTVEDVFTENEYPAPRGSKRRGGSSQDADDLSWGSRRTSKKDKKQSMIRRSGKKSGDSESEDSESEWASERDRESFVDESYDEYLGSRERDSLRKSVPDGHAPYRLGFKDTGGGSSYPGPGLRDDDAMEDRNKDFVLRGTEREPDGVMAPGGAAVDIKKINGTKVDAPDRPFTLESQPQPENTGFKSWGTNWTISTAKENGGNANTNGGDAGKGNSNRVENPPPIAGDPVEAPVTEEDVDYWGCPPSKKKKKKKAEDSVDAEKKEEDQANPAEPQQAGVLGGEDLGWGFAGKDKKKKKKKTKYRWDEEDEVAVDVAPGGKDESVQKSSLETQQPAVEEDDPWATWGHKDKDKKKKKRKKKEDEEKISEARATDEPENVQNGEPDTESAAIEPAARVTADEEVEEEPKPNPKLKKKNIMDLIAEMELEDD
ncbi:hypothetical protein PVAG01_05431 [Phlyctema vagabunda]|uniref:Fungal N-terminal domain-containing protein n=1 Tax=Phlyctema vagabunda TaxID=108571 RepID=A0ABR4PK24_9HELO